MLAEHVLSDGTKWNTPLPTFSSVAPVIYGSHNKSEIKSSFWCKWLASGLSHFFRHQSFGKTTNGWFMDTLRRSFPPLPLQRIQNIHKMHAVFPSYTSQLKKSLLCFLSDDYGMEIIWEDYTSKNISPKDRPICEQKQQAEQIHKMFTAKRFRGVREKTGSFSSIRISSGRGTGGMFNTLFHLFPLPAPLLFVIQRLTGSNQAICRSN